MLSKRLNVMSDENVLNEFGYFKLRIIGNKDNIKSEDYIKIYDAYKEWLTYLKGRGLR